MNLKMFIIKKKICEIHQNFYEHISEVENIIALLRERELYEFQMTIKLNALVILSSFSDELMRSKKRNDKIYGL